MPGLLTRAHKEYASVPWCTLNSVYLQYNSLFIQFPISFHLSLLLMCTHIQHFLVKINRIIIFIYIYILKKKKGQLSRESCSSLSLNLKITPPKKAHLKERKTLTQTAIFAKWFGRIFIFPFIYKLKACLCL